MVRWLVGKCGRFLCVWKERSTFFHAAQVLRSFLGVEDGHGVEEGHGGAGLSCPMAGSSLELGLKMITSFPRRHFRFPPFPYRLHEWWRGALSLGIPTIRVDTILPSA